ncbi:MAG TPA: J domain-containing protein [Solirubrobacterales bacterium]
MPPQEILELDDAYRLLGIGPDATDEEIRTQFRQLARRAHSDHGGADAAMARLNEAYAIVKESREGANGALLPRQDLDLATTASAEMARKEELRDDSRRAFDSAIRHRTSRLKQAQRQGTWAAIASGGLGVVIALMRTLQLDTVDTFEGEEIWLTSTTRLLLILICLSLSAIFAFLAWRASLRASWFETALEDFSDSLSDKNSFLRLIGILRTEAGLPERWTRDDLIDSISHWSEGKRPMRSRLLVAESIMGLISPRAGHEEIPLEDLANVAGPVDTARLIISKGLERELIDEKPAPEDPHAYAYTLTL